MPELILNGKSISLDNIHNDQDQLSQYEQKVVHFCQAWLSGQETFTIHTSGSTGKPKPIQLKRTQMMASAKLTGQVLKLQARDRALVCLSTDYIAGLMMLVRGLEFGLHLTVIDPVGQPLAPFSAESHFDFTAMVPLQLQETLNGPEPAVAILNQMKAVLVGGAPISAALKAQLQAVKTPLYHTYGMTETVTHIALKRLNGPEPSDAFIPFPGVQLALDERGCLSICATVTDGQIVQTNDLAQLNADGSFVWLGRVDNVINSGGVKVQVEKIESAIEQYLFQWANGRGVNRRFFVGGRSDARLGQRVVLVLEGESLSDEAAEALKLGLKTTLNKYEVPRQIYALPNLLETPTGKIDRLANLAQLGAILETE